MKTLYSIILAAGQSKRMQSTRTKVLHALAEKPLISHVVSTVDQLNPEQIFLVTANDGAEVYQVAQSALATTKLQHVIQDPPLGTGHAVQCVQSFLQNKTGTVLVVYGDTPLIQPSTLQSLIQYQQSGLAIAVLGMRLDNPGHYGRLITCNPQGSTAVLERIVEFNEASAQERQETLCNSGVMAIDAHVLTSLIHQLPLRPSKGEYYLTDLVELAKNQGQRCGVLETDATELLGVNNREDLATAEHVLQHRYRQFFMNQGVTLIDPNTVYFCHDTVIKSDVTIGPWVYFGPHVRIAAHVHIHPFCHLQDVIIEKYATVGPFARIRGNSILGEKAAVGNFVEIKNVNLGQNTKVKHLSYVGDAHVGNHTNIGAGVITCNYDGFNKWATTIGSNTLIGSNTALIAPLSIGNDVVIGANSTITDSVADNTLAIARTRQQDFQNRGQIYRQQQLASKKPKH